ncbi:MAG: 50S ribosomal protein L25 [Pseudomonadota bacterium]|nr:50S ribosomal protein L25 [Pseudomonadota bacterium]
MAIAELEVQPRSTLGKSAVKKMRAEGLVPAVLYGNKVESTPLAVNEHTLNRFFDKYGQSILVSLAFDADNKDGKKLVVVKDVQYHPLTGCVSHLDFYSIRIGVPIEVEVPLSFEGEAVGVAKGGLLQPVRRSLEIRCLPREIPEVFEIDVSALDIGDSIHVNDLDFAGIEFISEVNFTIVTVYVPKVEVEPEVEEGEELEEGEEELEAAEAVAETEEQSS